MFMSRLNVRAPVTTAIPMQHMMTDFRQVGRTSKGGWLRLDFSSDIVPNPYSLSMNRKYDEDHNAVGMVCCGRAVIMILKISCSLASSSRNFPPVAELSGWIVAISRNAS